MGFIITKTVLFLAIPPASLFIIIAAGFLVARFRPRLGKSLVAAGVILLYLLSTEVVSSALMRPHEAAAGPEEENLKGDAIVVLGGGVVDLAWLNLSASPANASIARLVKGIALYRKLHMPLVLMGGNGDPYRQVPADADAMAALAKEIGVPGKDLILENKSRNTIEGARALTRLIKGKRIILVTSAYHMRRSAAMFEKSGFKVVKAPAGYATEQRKISFDSFIPHAQFLGTSSNACSEYLSLAWYRLTKQI